MAPLLDAVNEGCYKEMGKFLKKREEFFNKEIANLKKKEQNLQKKLEKLEPIQSLLPKEESKVLKEKDHKSPKVKKGKEMDDKAKKKTKKEL